MSSVKGFAPWKPAVATQPRLEEVLDVINEDPGVWPLSQRYWLYRLMSVHGWHKWDEYARARSRKNGYKDYDPNQAEPLNPEKQMYRDPYNLNNILDRGRRAGLILWVPKIGAC